MSLIEPFEDIKAWQEARKLVKITNKERFSKDYGMRDQIRRGAVSAMMNIAEGFDCDSNIEFARFLGFARRSAAEFELHYEQARKTKALIGGFKHSLKKKSSHQYYLTQ